MILLKPEMDNFHIYYKNILKDVFILMNQYRFFLAEENKMPCSIGLVCLVLLLFTKEEWVG